jgi:hypothetical protein
MTVRNEPPISRPLTGRVAVVTGAARGIRPGGSRRAEWGWGGCGGD